jgi:hypothetical protein
MEMRLFVPAGSNTCRGTALSHLLRLPKPRGSFKLSNRISLPSQEELAEQLDGGLKQTDASGREAGE